MKTLEELITYNAEFAAKTFNDTGSLTAMWVAETRGGEILPIVAPLTDKELVLKAIKKLFKDHKIVRYVFMTEAWTLVARKDHEKEMTEYAENHSLADHPDRREIIMVTAEDKDQIIMGMMFILRPEHGKPRVSEFKIQDRATHMEGRFTGLLPA